MAKPVNRTFCSADTQTLHCDKCGCHMAIPLGQMDFVCAVIRAFNKAHRHCRPGGGSPTFVSVPKVPVTTEANRG